MARSIIENREYEASGKIQSPYPALQALLPRLASLSATRQAKPVFRQRKEAKEYLSTLSDPVHIVLTPVWALDHADLRNSQVVGWSVAYFPC